MNAIRPRIAASLAALLFAGAAHAQTVPAGDYHQHVFSAADIAMIGPSAGLVPLDADQLIPLLDAAGIKRAVLLSIAYMAGSPSRKVDDEVAKVRMEKDWTAAQAARHPGRLIAFCSFNPFLQTYAKLTIVNFAVGFLLRRGWFHPALTRRVRAFPSTGRCGRTHRHVS
jgi:predicted TIM-barrel fold metal-dependent hydrolase